MSVTIESNEQGSRLQIDGDLTAYEVQEVCQALAKIMEQSGQIRLDMQQVQNCDTAGIQLLLATAKTAHTLHKQLWLDNTPDVVCVAARRAGVAWDELVSPSGEVTYG